MNTQRRFPFGALLVSKKKKKKNQRADKNKTRSPIAYRRFRVLFLLFFLAKPIDDFVEYYWTLIEDALGWGLEFGIRCLEFQMRFVVECAGFSLRRRIWMNSRNETLKRARFAGDFRHNFLAKLMRGGHDPTAGRAITKLT